jgi:hypothetical protein
MDIRKLSNEELQAEHVRRRDALAGTIQHLNRTSEATPTERTEETRRQRRTHLDSIADRRREEEEEDEIDKAFESSMETKIELAARVVVAKIRADRVATGVLVGLDTSAMARAEALVDDGRSPKVAYVSAEVEAHKESYLGEDPLDDIVPSVASDETKGAAEKTFIRHVAEVAVERIEQHDGPIAGEGLDALDRYRVFQEIASQPFGWRWTDATLTESGVTLWNHTYRLGQSDDAVLACCEKIVARWQAEDGSEGDATAEGALREILTFSAKWAVHAFQRITTTHTYAAALMCTDTDRESLETIETQWHAFMVLVPNGLLRVGPDAEYNRVLVRIGDDDSASILLVDQNSGESAQILATWARSLPDLLAEEDAQFMELAESAQRAIILAKRLVAGLLLAMQHVDNFKSKTYPAREKRRDGRVAEEPAHRVVMVGKPISVDCRPAVADYLASGSKRKNGAPPSVQVIVRGHYKRQVVGVGRKGRKVIWVQPYWRGPDGAPILTHPKRIGDQRS